MASLNTLRTRGGVIITVVIGLALFSFIVGDINLQGCSDQSIGRINGEKIDYMEYSNEINKYTLVSQAMSGKESLTSQEQNMVQDLAWESLIVKHSYQPGFEKMGLWCSEAEQIDMVTGVYLSPVISNTFANPNTGIYDPTILQNFMTNIELDGSGRTATLWSYFKDQMVIQRSIEKYIALVTAGNFITDLEVRAGVQATNNSYDARILKSEYSLIADSLVNVDEQEIKAYYQAHKDRYKQSASREIEYVLFELNPSVEDFEEAKRMVDEIADEFGKSDDPMQYALLNSHTKSNNSYIRESMVSSEIAAVVLGNPNALYGPALNGDKYTLAREASTKMMPDSVGAKHIVLAPDQIELADSLLNVIRKGSAIDQLAALYSQDEVSASEGGYLGVFAPEAIPVMTDQLVAAKVGDVFLVNAPYGVHIVELTSKSPMVKKVQIATIEYMVEPSTATQQATYNKALSFLASADKSYDNFKKTSNEQSLPSRVARLKSSDREVNGVEDSRELIRWAFNGKSGDVSQIMTVANNYVVATLARVIEEGSTPLESASTDIKPLITKEKRAKILVEQLANSTTLEQAAQKTNGQIAELVEGINMGSFYVEGFGVEQELIGAICSTTEINKVSKPVIGASGVFLFEVVNIEVDDLATIESERVKLESSTSAHIEQNVANSLLESTKVVDSRVRFF